MAEEKPYFVRHYSDSTQKLRAPLTATLGDCTISVREIPEPRAPFLPSQLTWEYSVRTTAIGPITALNKAGSYISYLNDILVFVEGAAIGDPRPFLAIDIDNRFPNREFAQALFFEFPEFRSRRRLNIDNLRLFFEDHLDRSAHEQSGRRISRALHLVRRSYLEPDPIDRFEDLWTALEALNPLIRDKYKTHRNYAVVCEKCRSAIECKRCGTPLENVDSSSGIRHVICEVLGKPADWPDLRKTRIAIVHATEDPFPLAQTLQPKVDTLRHAVTAAILDLLDIPELDSVKFSSSPLPLATQPEFLMKGQLFELPAAEIESNLDRLPYFEFSWQEPLARESEEEGRKTEKASFSLTPVGFNGRFSFNMQVLIKKGPDDEGVSSLGINQSPDSTSGESTSA